ncbi:MAG TPA: hypothetical protein VN213_07110, partial [Solirubrobacteraceae bacterium]|nr:hypothetical protein [Solirubrobacteraceae bacterium]
MMLLLDPGGVALTLDIDAGGREDRLQGPASSTPGPTLDELLSETWDGLLATAPVSCPVCDAPMSPRW